MHTSAPAVPDRPTGTNRSSERVAKLAESPLSSVWSRPKVASTSARRCFASVVPARLWGTSVASGSFVSNQVAREDRPDERSSAAAIETFCLEAARGGRGGPEGSRVSGRREGGAELVEVVPDDPDRRPGSAGRPRSGRSAPSTARGAGSPPPRCREPSGPGRARRRGRSSRRGSPVLAATSGNASPRSARYSVAVVRPSSTFGSSSVEASVVRARARVAGEPLGHLGELAGRPEAVGDDPVALGRDEARDARDPVGRHERPGGVPEASERRGREQVGAGAGRRSRRWTGRPCPARDGRRPGRSRPGRRSPPAARRGRRSSSASGRSVTAGMRRATRSATVTIPGRRETAAASRAKKPPGRRPLRVRRWSGQNR